MRISDWSSDVCSSDLWTMVTDPALTLLTDQRAKQNNQKLTWRLVVAQELTPDINLYASYNRGTHSGGFSIGGPGTPPYKPEVLDAYEVGLKSRLFDGVFELNMAGFYYDYSNMQVKTVIVGVTLIDNAASSDRKSVV